MKLWTHEQGERLIYYPSKERKSRLSIVIFPGGAYSFLAEHEGKGYAEYLNAQGYDAFVCLYRVAPNRYPLPLLDARRAIRLVRAQAEELGLDASKIVAMGSSAGGSLVSLLSTVTDPLEGEKTDETDDIPFLPDGQVLCYPVISLEKDEVTHKDSRRNLCGEDYGTAVRISPENNVSALTPPAFLWHTANDPAVSVENTLLYARALTAHDVSAEVHIFPRGYHGMGLALDDGTVGAWRELLVKWLENLDKGVL